MALIDWLGKFFGWLWHRHEDKKMWEIYGGLCVAQEGNPARLVFTPKTTDERKYYEKMVEDGLLARDLPGTYYLVGR